MLPLLSSFFRWAFLAQDAATEEVVTADPAIDVFVSAKRLDALDGKALYTTCCCYENALVWELHARVLSEVRGTSLMLAIRGEHKKPKARK